jgi:soluble lytic murein transglycosylase
MPTRWASILTPRRRSTAEEEGFPLSLPVFPSQSQSGVSERRNARFGGSARRNKLIAAALCAVLVAAAPLDTLAQTRTSKKKKGTHKPKAAPCNAGCKANTSPPQITATTPEEDALQRELVDLARGLRTAAPSAYERLSAFAGRNSSNVWGARAALALGYEDYSKNRAQQALGWLKKAEGDTTLREYALYWSAQSKRTMKRTADAYIDLQTIQQDYPDTAMKEQFLESYAPTAVELGHAQDAIDALSAYPAISAKPALLLERAHAYQVAHQLARAAKDYQTLYFKFPLTDEAKPAGIALTQINHAMGTEYPYPGVEMQQIRGQAFFDAHKWREARAEFEKLQGMLRDPENPARQLAQLRVAQCRVQPKGSPSVIAAVKTSAPEVDAERLYALSQAYRSAKKEPEMMAAIEQATQKYPQSKWAEESLMAAGNFYWVGLDRARAAGYNQRMLEQFPNGKNAFNAEWRITWVAYLNRQPDTDDRLTAFLLKYPVSANSVDALYWLGRNSEREGNPAHARSFYDKAVERFPETYFGHAAAARLAKIGPGEENPADFLQKIPPPPALRPFDEPIPSSVADRWARAMALRTIGFDASAEQELKAAYFATASPRFLVEAAQAAFDQGHFGAGMAYGRLAVPSFDSRKIDDVPRSVWRALYPLPYESALRREAARNNFDPMLAAGLIRQESTFQADAVSRANAVGLMQVLPTTGKLLAKQLKVKYAKTKLFDPEYNIQLGMLYIAGLLRSTGEPEYALAAFNAGEDRIAAWRAERNYEEIPELVESIPFTETREYVQIVLRNSEVYRLIYGANAPAPISQSGLAPQRSKPSSAR